MLELIRGKTLAFSFPDVHEDANLEIELMRTFRVPDDGRLNFLPPGFEPFFMEHVEDYRGYLPEEWIKHKGLLLPMYQAEALWIRFNSFDDYPFAVRIGAGKICAVTGDRWKSGLRQGIAVDDEGNEEPLQNYVAVPGQPWLDGFNTGDGIVRQFVAEPLGSGMTVEEQLTGSADFGGLQIQVYPLRGELWEEELQSRPTFDDDHFECLCCGAPPDEGLGLAAGGRIHQEIDEDTRDIRDYDVKNSSRVFIHIVNSKRWRDITGLPMPRRPVSAEDYTKAGLPWFDFYSDAKPLPASSKLAGVKSVGEMDDSVAKKDAAVAAPQKVADCSKKKVVTDGNW